MNTYRGPSFTSLFDDVAAGCSRPLLITEFGSDAYNVVEGVEEQDGQAEIDLANWREILSEVAAGRCLGGFTFQFSDELMANQQKRADWANDHGIVTHQPIEGTYLPDSESCCSLLCVYEWWRDGRGWVFQGWPKDSEDYQKTYLDFYTCIYNSAYMLVTVHGENLSREDKYIYFGYGFSIIPTEDPLYGMERPLYAMEIYVGSNAVWLWDV